jgi:tetratricopeptide (TPR) repeat protein
MMEPLFERIPDHPGLAHYLIHAFDAPALAQHGVAAAQVYADLAPSAPHALHMPSHIFTRLGMWDESIATNRRSADAEPVPAAAVHPLDYMVYAFLQQGRDTEARAVVEGAVRLDDRYYGGLLGYNFAAMPARYALERGAWAEAARLELPTGALPFVAAVTHFARGMGAARSGDLAAARAQLPALEALRDELLGRQDPDWPPVIEAQRLAVASWIALAEGRTDDALRLAARAAESEESVEKHPITPGPLLPARELQGDMLIQLQRYGDAQRAYEQNLQREPRRARSLFGAARAAELAGNAAAAREHYTELLDVMAQADAARSEPRAARVFLGVGRR